MPSCPFYNNSNLDSTGGEMNNPYALIQQAGKYKRNRKNKTNKSNKKINKRKSKKRITKRKLKRVHFSRKLFF